jgi:hypothetical protein
VDLVLVDFDDRSFAFLFPTQRGQKLNMGHPCFCPDGTS